MYILVYTEMPGQPDRLRGVERGEGNEVGGVWSGMEWHGVAHYCFCVDLLVVVLANIYRVVSDKSVVMNADLRRTCSCRHVW